MKIVYSQDQMAQIARQLIDTAQSRILCFYGEMGAGKTTLIKALVKELGAADTGTSPTFGIVNEYHTVKGELLAFHFDFYRLNDEMEALDLGLEDYLDRDAWIFIEWPEKIASWLPESATDVYIKVLDTDKRQLRLVHKL